MVLNASQIDIIEKESACLIEDMKDAVCFFECIIPHISRSVFIEKIEEYTSQVKNNEFSGGYILGKEDLDCFLDGDILTLSSTHKVDHESHPFFFQFIFDWVDDKKTLIDLDVICYREGILIEGKEKERFVECLRYIHKIKQLFAGKALYWT
ncbi:hypothetical protein [Candidatus Uabimicrobium sp. HlEnr_7]|uniref:hypothetical protein n=1 Tax=Candidatus Uabimicrobium helgolandensis TaxID=3095367 RepID=UPI003558FA3F